MKHKIKEFINLCHQHPEINLSTLTIAEGERILAEKAFPPYEYQSPQVLFSMTKSISALAIGIASDQGLLSLTERVIDIFPEYTPCQPSVNLKKLTIKHLLTMSIGVKQDNQHLFKHSANWTETFFQQEFTEEPGSYYLYNSYASHLLSAIITKKSQRLLQDYLQEFLFTPLQIEPPQWELAPENINCGGFGLSLKPSALVKIGQLLLNQGRYKGEQLISQSFIKEATTPQIIKSTTKQDLYRGNLYGYQFHLNDLGHYRLDGAFGQVCLIIPEQTLVICLTSHPSSTKELLKAVTETIVKPVESIQPSLEEKGSPAWEQVPEPRGKWLFQGKYHLPKNPLELTTVEFFTQNQLCLNRKEKDPFIFHFGLNKETRGKTIFIKDQKEVSQPYVIKSSQTALGLCLTVYFIETPYILSLTFALIESKLHFSFNINVSFSLTNVTVIGYR